MMAGEEISLAGADGLCLSAAAGERGALRAAVGGLNLGAPEESFVVANALLRDDRGPLRYGDAARPCVARGGRARNGGRRTGELHRPLSQAAVAEAARGRACPELSRCMSVGLVDGSEEVVKAGRSFTGKYLAPFL